jgi:hypothetical protein
MACANKGAILKKPDLPKVGVQQEITMLSGTSNRCPDIVMLSLYNSQSIIDFVTMLWHILHGF